MSRSRRKRVRVSMCDTENNGQRNWSQLPAEEIDRIIALYEARDQMALAGEAQQLGTSVATLERQIRAAIMIRDKYAAKYLAAALPESPSPIRDQYTVLEEQDAIVISDIEVPDHDVWVLRAALLTGMRYGIRRLIWAGDIIATDQDALNSWLKTHRDISGERSYRADLRELRQIINAMAEWFTDGQYHIMGNHDDRVGRKTGGEVTIDMLLDDTPVQFSEYSYMYMHFPRNGEWTYICHQYNYSKTPVKLAQDIWSVESAPDGSKSKMHIVTTHTHIAQDGFSPDGNWRCVSLGCARDPRRTKYARERATKFPKWNQGLLMIRDGYFWPLTRHGTDWQAFLGDDFYAMLADPEIALVQ